jgi:lysophospholipase L1-like esterase
MTCLRRLCLVVLAMLMGVPAHAADQRREHWVVTWAASPQPNDRDAKDPALAIANQTLRQIVRVSLGGRRVRLRLSNAYGTTPLLVGAVHLGRHGGGAGIVAGSDHVVTFGQVASVTIPPGALVVSDAVELPVPAASELAVSLFFPMVTSATTVHTTARQTTYLSPPGDFSGAATIGMPTTSTAWYFISAVEVDAVAPAQAIVALGDSVTDGAKSSLDANHRWPDYLAQRLNAAARPRAIVNAGIGGNRLIGQLVGDNALARLDRDVLALPGVRYVIVLEGINDIGTHTPDSSAEELIAAQRQIIVRAHALGVRVIGATLIPFEGAPFHGFYTAAGEGKRQAVNRWIRSGGAYDGVIDFEAALRDPEHPARLLPAFDSGDHAHPNDAGYKAMADAVDLRLFAD